MISFIRNIYIGIRFFYLMAAVIVLFVLSFPYPYLFPVALASFGVAMVLLFVDTLILFMPGSNVKANRILPNTLSLGDETEIKIRLYSDLRLLAEFIIHDETPYQLQLRDLALRTTLYPGESELLTYKIRPTERGKYEFGNLNVFTKSMLGLVERRFILPAEKTVAVYPSVLQMRQMELKVFNKMNLNEGIKRVRRLGHSTEYEQIKNYVSGDDYRKINWKATSRKAELMVNQYEDEKAQQVYCVIDKSRSMRMPFNEMTLLDYAINSTLAISNIALRKSDRAGLLTFSDKLGSRLPAERNPTQIKKIQDLLYKQKTQFNDANFELLYFGVRNYIKGRSLLLLYTNFESNYAVQRALPLLRKINQMHLLVVIFFENTELDAASEMEPKDIRGIYTQTIAQKLAYEKTLIVQELKKYGIQTILTTPEQLSVDTINKYLELKSRGLI